MSLGSQEGESLPVRADSHPILLYDGHCVLCNVWVRVLLFLDDRAVLRFAKLQSPFARELLHPHGLDPDRIDTVVLIEPAAPSVVASAVDYRITPDAEVRCSLRSDAVLGAVARLGSPWKYLRYARYFPRFLRDGIYDFVARHRYTVFGRHESCPAPPFDRRERFLDFE